MGSHARLTWHGGMVERREHQGAVHGLTVAAEHLLGASRAVVPFDDFNLSDSGDTDVDPGSLKASVFYDSIYARYQHERLDLRHDPGRTAKYLETPLAEQDAVMRALIAAAVRRSLRG